MRASQSRLSDAHSGRVSLCWPRPGAAGNQLAIGDHAHVGAGALVKIVAEIAQSWLTCSTWSTPVAVFIGGESAASCMMSRLKSQAADLLYGYVTAQ